MALTICDLPAEMAVHIADHVDGCSILALRLVSHFWKTASHDQFIRQYFTRRSLILDIEGVRRLTRLGSTFPRMIQNVSCLEFFCVQPRAIVNLDNENFWADVERVEEAWDDYLDYTDHDIVEELAEFLALISSSGQAISISVAALGPRNPICKTSVGSHILQVLQLATWPCEGAGPTENCDRNLEMILKAVGDAQIQLRELDLCGRHQNGYLSAIDLWSWYGCPEDFSPALSSPMSTLSRMSFGIDRYYFNYDASRDGGLSILMELATNLTSLELTGKTRLTPRNMSHGVFRTPDQLDCVQALRQNQLKHLKLLQIDAEDQDFANVLNHHQQSLQSVEISLCMIVYNGCWLRPLEGMTRLPQCRRLRLRSLQRCTGRVIGTVQFSEVCELDGDDGFHGCDSFRLVCDGSAAIMRRLNAELTVEGGLTYQ